MDKRLEANRKVREAITKALFEMMEVQEISKITISDLIKKAGVARISYYRNYETKEDILVGLVHDVLDDFRDTADYDLSDFCSLKHIRRIFTYFDQYRNYVINLYKSGYGTMLLNELNQFHEYIAGDMSANSPDRYSIYAFIGAVYNTAMIWLLEDTQTTPDCISEVVFNLVR